MKADVAMGGTHLNQKLTANAPNAECPRWMVKLHMDAHGRLKRVIRVATVVAMVPVN